MWIVSQYGDIYNTGTMLCIERYEKNVCIIYDTGKSIIAGRYSSEEKAMEVMKEIAATKVPIDTQGVFRDSNGVLRRGNEVLEKPNPNIFYMPQDNEVE